MRLLKKCVGVVFAAAFVAAVVVFPVNAYETTDDGNFHYEIAGEPGSETVTIIEYVGDSTNVVVPSEIGGIPVTVIATNSFGEKAVSTVSLPDSITTIGYGAFAASAIESIVIPSGVTRIERLTFDSCTNLETVVLPEGLTAIGKKAFLGCSALHDIYIPGSVETIDGTAFNGSGLSTVYGVPGSAAETFAAGKTFVPVPAFTGRQLALGSDLSMIFYAEYSDGGETLTGEFGVGENSRTITASKSGGEYVFRFDGITPQLMGETITASISVVGLPTVTYKTSVREYLLEVAETYSGDAPLVTLVADLLEYGAAAQKYLDGTLEDSELVNYGTGLTPSTFTSAPPSIKSKTRDSSSAGFDIVSVGLRFDSVNKLFVIFEAGDGFSITVNEDDITNAAVFDEGEYTVYTGGIAASDFDTPYVFRLYDGGTLIQTLTYSVNSMVAAKCATEDATGALAKATYNYGVSASNYVSSRPT